MPRENDTRSSVSESQIGYSENGRAACDLEPSRARESGALLDFVLDDLALRVAERLATSNGHVPEAPEPWRLLTLEEAAACLTRSTRWVRERVKAGDLAYVRLDGGAFAFDPDDVRAFARGRRVGGEETLE